MSVRKMLSDVIYEGETYLIHDGDTYDGGLSR